MLRLHADVPEFQRIIWLASYPKSGNTWVRLFLESYILGSIPDVSKPMRCATSDTFMATYQSVCPVPIPKLDHITMMYLRPAALLHLLTSSDSQVKISDSEFDLFVKTHNLNILIDEGVPTIPKRYTNRALYIVRDPRDIVPSLANHLGLDIDQAIEFLGNQGAILKHTDSQALSMLGTWSMHVKSWLKCENYPIAYTRYEDYVTFTRETFRKTLIFLGFKNIDEERFERAIRATKFEKLQKDEQEKGFHEVAESPFFRSGKIGAWKNVLTDSQATKIVENHKEMMERFQYIPSQT
jgi:hypothetical protein